MSNNNQYDLTKPGAVRSLEPVIVEVRDDDCQVWEEGELLAIRPGKEFNYTTLDKEGYVENYRHCRHLKWTPKEGEMFYYVDEAMNIEQAAYRSKNDWKVKVVECNNYYQTVEQAEQARDKIQAIHNEER